LAKKLTVAGLSTTDRIERAKAKTKKLVDHAIHLLNLHEANRIIGYSPKLADQIPKSHAANAFNVFRDGILQVRTHQRERPSQTSVVAF
jgi:hypothetical protein